MTDQEPQVPPANGVECIDCPGFGNYYEGEVECPEEPDHVTEPVYISSKPLGRSDDDESRVGEQWIYDAQV